MHAKDFPLDNVLNEQKQWVIPVYQRHYAWKTGSADQLPNLWEDVQAIAQQLLDGEQPSPHFVGAIIYEEPGHQPHATVRKRNLVDGQQRMTTFSLLLCAIREVAKRRQLDGIATSAEVYLLNPTNATMEDPQRDRLKLWPSSADRPHYLAIVSGGWEEVRSEFPGYFFKNGRLIAGQAPKMIAAFVFLVDRVDEFVVESEAQQIPAVRTLDCCLNALLRSFQIVNIVLEADDDAQGIFASLNGNAEPLTAFDLVRNDVFNRARRGAEDEDLLYERHWQRLESPFWKQEVKQGRFKRPRTDHLIAHSLVAEQAREINIGQVANAYRAFAEENSFPSVKEEISHLLAYADVYELLEGRSKGGEEARLAVFLQLWELSAFHPLILWLGRQALDTVEKRVLYRGIESYVVRRDLCGLSRKNYNRIVQGVLREAHEGGPGVVLQHLRSLEGESSKFPTDADVAQGVGGEDVYRNLVSMKLRYILREVELAVRTPHDESIEIDLKNLTVEHLLPRKWASHWPLPDGTVVPHETRAELVEHAPESCTPEVLAAADTRSRLVNTLGNLTLVTSTLNPAMSNAAWPKKRGHVRGSLLALNREVASHERWDEQAIRERSVQLAEHVNAIWPRNDLTIN